MTAYPTLLVGLFARWQIHWPITARRVKRQHYVSLAAYPYVAGYAGPTATQASNELGFHPGV